MWNLRITTFNSGQVVPAYETVVDDGQVLIQLEMTWPTSEVEYYDFRLGTPVQEHLLDEVYQLVTDLIAYQVAKTGGLQPQLFP